MAVCLPLPSSFDGSPGRAEPSDGPSAACEQSKSTKILPIVSYTPRREAFKAMIMGKSPGGEAAFLTLANTDTWAG